MAAIGAAGVDYEGDEALDLLQGRLIAAADGPPPCRVQMPRLTHVVPCAAKAGRKSIRPA